MGFALDGASRRASGERVQHPLMSQGTYRATAVKGEGRESSPFWSAVGGGWEKS